MDLHPVKSLENNPTSSKKLLKLTQEILSEKIYFEDECSIPYVEEEIKDYSSSFEEKTQEKTKLKLLNLTNEIKVNRFSFEGQCLLTVDDCSGDVKEKNPVCARFIHFDKVVLLCPILQLIHILYIFATGYPDYVPLLPPRLDFKFAFRENVVPVPTPDFAANTPNQALRTENLKTFVNNFSLSMLFIFPLTLPTVTINH